MCRLSLAWLGDMRDPRYIRNRGKTGCVISREVCTYASVPVTYSPMYMTLHLLLYYICTSSVGIWGGGWCSPLRCSRWSTTTRDFTLCTLITYKLCYCGLVTRILNWCLIRTLPATLATRLYCFIITLY